MSENTEPNNNENPLLGRVEATDEIKEAYLSYSLDVITNRAIPDIRDGFKPVHRHVLYGMFEDGTTFEKAHRKSARIVGNVLGKFHPHGDCLYADTKIFLADGSFKTIKELFEEGENKDILCIDKDGSPVIAEAHSFRIGQYADTLYKIHLSSGETVVATSNHPFMTNKMEWKKAEELKERDQLFSAKLNLSEDREYRPNITVMNQRKVLLQALCENPLEVIHHKDKNVNNNANSNLSSMTRAEHAKLHKDYIDGLNAGRETMKYGVNKHIFTEKNSALMTAYNVNKPLYTAYKVLDYCNNNGLDLTEENYNMVRKDCGVYNATTLNKLIDGEYISDFTDLLKKYLDGYSPVLEAKIRCSKTVVKEPKEWNHNVSKAQTAVMKNHAFEVIDELINKNLDINSSNYEEMRKKLIQINGKGFGKIYKRNYPIVSEETLQELFIDYKKERIFVESIEIVSVNKEPMYDFTVDDFENMLIPVGQNNDSTSMICVHNSSVYDAMARMAQDFSLRYPLVDGHGNFGSIDGDSPAAMRYCVTGDTLIETDKGLQKIKDLVPDAKANSTTNISIKIRTKNGTFKPASKFFHSGIHSVIELKTDQGITLRGSHNHPVFCKIIENNIVRYKWKTLESIEVNDLVCSLYILSQNNSEQFKEFPTDKEIKETDFLIQKVVAVNDVGEDNVYSIKVDSDCHSFITNGIVSHNTEARLGPIAMELIKEISEETVDWKPNYDESLKEPIVLPGRFPNLLVNGSDGIAVGMATKMPPHNLKETVSAINAVLENPNITLQALMKHIKGPDFPTGGIIVGIDGIKDYFETGKGQLNLRAKAHIEDNRGKPSIVITELPYQLSKGKLIERIALLVKDKNHKSKMELTNIVDIRDESDRETGIRLVIELKKDSNAQKVLSVLFKETPMSQTFGVHNLCLVDNTPKTLGLREIIQEYIKFQTEVIVRRTNFRLEKIKARLHILEGYIIALDPANIDEVINIIKKSTSGPSARTNLMKRFKLSEIQAQAVLDLRLQKLNKMDVKDIKQEYAEKKKIKTELEAILKSEAKQKEIIHNDLVDISQKFGDARRTEILAVNSNNMDNVEEMLLQVQEERVVVFRTSGGYIKRVNLDSFKTNTKGTRGNSSIEIGTKDTLKEIICASTGKEIWFLTDDCNVHMAMVHEIIDQDKNGKGRSVKPLLNDEAGKVFTSVVVDSNDKNDGEHYLLTISEKGYLKRSLLSEYVSNRSTIVGFQCKPGDKIIGAVVVKEDDNILLTNNAGFTNHFAVAEIPVQGRKSSGVIGMKTGKEKVISFAVYNKSRIDNVEFVIVTENGYSKSTLVAEYPLTKKGSKGVKTAVLDDITGEIVSSLVIDKNEQKQKTIFAGSS